MNNDKNYFSFKIFHRFWLAKIPWLILHNQLALTKFGRCEQQTIDSMVYWLENVLIDGVLIWKRGNMGNIPSIQLVSRSGVPVVIHEWAKSRKMTFTAFRRRNGCFSDYNWTEGKQEYAKHIGRRWVLSTFLGVYARNNLCLYHDWLCRKMFQSLE